MPREAVPTERQSVSVAEARQLILDSVRPLGDETVSLLDATGRVLAEEISAGILIPPADNSAMDGFALRAADVARTPALLRVVDDLPAGRAPSRKLGPGEAARIMTGAAIPEGADAVVMIEHTEAAGDDVRVLEQVEPGENVRRAGEDVRPGTPIASPGARLRPALIGMLAAIGRTSLRVAQRPRVAVLSTGDELVEPDRLSGDGRIVSSNSYNLQASLRELGFAALYLGIAPDRPDEIEARFRQALACDAVISTGGVSVGDRDWIKQVLAGLGGRMRLWRVRMKPGAPLAFATVEGRPVFGLPGNPVSTLVAFEQFVRPALLRMAGLRALHRPVIRARLATDYKKAPGRLHFVRVRLEQRGGETLAHPTGDQGSHILLSMVHADGLAIVPEDSSRLAAGSEIAVQLLARDDLHEDPGF